VPFLPIPGGIVMPQLDERTGFAILVAGICLLIVGYLWFISRGFGTSTLWGFISLIPGVNLLFPACRFRRAAAPLVLILLGALVCATPYAINAIAGDRVPTDANIEEKPTVGGQTEDRITLTKADPAQYAILRDRKTFAVIQWANADVTDDHVELLRGMTELRELDLNTAAITDRSLAVIAALPKLESLRIGCAGITDEGFRTHILPLANLKQLDLTGSKVKRSTASEWTNAKPGRVRPNL
jgi:hypothetical protein